MPTELKFPNCHEMRTLHKNATMILVMPVFFRTLFPHKLFTGQYLQNFTFNARRYHEKFQRELYHP